MSLYQKNLGKLGEQKGLLFLKNQGFSIVKKNFHTPLGEIDIIAKKDKTLYFIEVKTRSNLKKGYPYEAVNKIKLSHLKKAAQYFLLKFPFKDYKMKIGVISILLENDNEVINFYDDLM